MPDLEDRDLPVLVINKIDDPIHPLSQPEAISVARELFRTLGPGVRSQALNLGDDALTIGLGANCLQLLGSRGFNQ